MNREVANAVSCFHARGGTDTLRNSLPRPDKLSSSMVAGNLCRGPPASIESRERLLAVLRSSLATGHGVDLTRNWSVKPDKSEKFESLQTQSAFSSVGPSGISVSHRPQLGGQAPLCWATRHCCVAAGLPLDDSAKRPSDELASNSSRDRNAANGFQCSSSENTNFAELPRDFPVGSGSCTAAVAV